MKKSDVIRMEPHENMTKHGNAVEKVAIKKEKGMEQDHPNSNGVDVMEAANVRVCVPVRGNNRG